MSKSFKEINIRDNFYQSSSFFPMPLTLIGTLDEKEELTSFGSYSLIFPYYIAGKEYYAMVLECRNSSNTAKGLLRNGKCTINFLPYSKKNFKNHVDMGFPGDTPKEKANNLKFALMDGESQKLDPKNKYPKIIKEALQVFECTWVKELDNAQNDKILEEYEGPYHDFNGITSKYGAHFILRIDHILLKDEYYNALINNVNRSNFCPLPTNWGYRDSAYFWCSDYRKPHKGGIPNREVDISSIKYAVDRVNNPKNISFTDDALKTMVKIPRPFLKLVIQGCIKWAEDHNVSLIGSEEMKRINEDRKKKN